MRQARFALLVAGFWSGAIPLVVLNLAWGVVPMSDKVVPLNMQRRVPSPRGGFLGVRVSSGGKGWWSGVPADEYDQREGECEIEAMRHLLVEAKTEDWDGNA